MSHIDDAIEVLQKTNDGDDLAPHHLGLVQDMVNGWISEQDEVEFSKLLANVRDGYTIPCFHGIEHLTRDHEGYIYWKGKNVEHYDYPWCYSNEAKVQAEEVAHRCKTLEDRGEVVSTTSVIWRWED